MGQSRSAHHVRFFQFFLCFVLLAIPIACDKPAPPPTSTSPRIASLVPAATDLLLAMHAGDRLVAVSNYDTQPGVQSLPRVGDYQQIDWEKLTALRPTVMIVQMRPDHMPPGLLQRADSLGIKLVNVQIEQVEDLYTAAGILADTAGKPAEGPALVASLRSQLDAVRSRATGQPTVRTLIVIDADPKFVVGRGTFINDALEAAGGENALPADMPHWPTIDRETLLSLKPDVILQLLPGASPQVLAQAKSNWQALADVPAVKNGKVYTITDWFLLQPGSHVGETATIFAEKLHP